MAEALYETADVFTGPDEGNSGYESPDNVSEIQNYAKSSTKESKMKAKKHLDQMENVTLNIAVTGESGVGKSTFVNAIRGLKDGEPGAAETGVTETTLRAVRYTHPTMPNVYIWDLPGIGTPNFKAKRYLKELQFDNFDFFIIIGSNRFKENDIMLAKEIQKMKKTFYFVRSKVDNDIQAESRKKNFNEEQVLQKIKQSCRENLAPVGHPKVFLISTFDLGKYDFNKLLESLKDNLSDHKWLALINSLPVCSVGMIEKKKKLLNNVAIAAAAAAAPSAGVFLPGFSVGCEIGIMLKFFQTAHVSFGLDDRSIHNLAERINKPEVQLKSAMKSHFVHGVSDSMVAAMFRTKGMTAAKTLETVFSGLPGMAIAFGTTLFLLRQGIKEMAEDAKAVLAAADL
ncbi:interferon-inducible GTPase 5-like [Myripristis murdjan]|uniref:interferon-inducible GTPase 5-like n=1 Tax=Myripristis murdjan TaxID=586833 RepID=UPI001175E4A7|nr:interferon-inducible GTPase 5-like [Myripristis murdjan]